MGDLQNQQVGAEQEDLQNRPPPGAKQESRFTAQARSMLENNASAVEMARFVHAHPSARDEIMTLIHQTPGLGNGFANQVAVEIRTIFQAEADGGPEAAPQNGAAKPTDPAKARAAADLVGEVAAEAANKNAKPARNIYNSDELRNIANGDGSALDNKPSTKADAPKNEAPKETKDEAPAEAAKPNRNIFSSNELRNIADGDGSALDNKPSATAEAPVEASKVVKDEAPKQDAAAKVAEAPVEASKVLKDETVIASSQEEKKPEILRTSEVLKDPTQNPDEPQKASDVVKDDDAENEGGGAGKAEVGPVRITASVLRVRSSPKINKGNIVGRLTKGTVVEAIGHQGEWVEIQYKGQTAFVHSSFVVGAEEVAQPTAQQQIPPATAAT